MKIVYSRRFVKNFKLRVKRYPKLHKRFDQRMKLFIQDSSLSILKDHRLVGKLKSFRAFSVTGDARVIYSRENKNTVIFIDVGTHNQVYSMR
ncbi:type II toxin-antitoxin system mRNA interferase toxin, RelE/StbE family [Patescibacteria group bacterium]|nr:type II toxin-antitoxin system mRNA interferase toxin, RelE/StbE family [Patescibacteria group bacterium]